MIKQAMFLSAALVTFAVGCGGGGEESVKAAESYATAACACKDTACTTKASQDYASAAQAAAAKAKSMSEGDVKKITDATSKATDCMTKLAMAGVPK